MKIIYLNNFNYARGGAENVFLNESEMMTNYGHTTHVYSRQHPNNLPSPLGDLYPDEMKTDRVCFDLQGLRDFSNIFYNLKARRGLHAVLDRISIDIAHAHNIYGGLTTSVLDFLKRKRIPVVMTLHDYKLICPNYKLMHHGKICEDCKMNNYFMAIKNQCHKESLIASTIYSLETYFNHIFQKYRRNIRKFIAPSKFLKYKFIEFGWSEKEIDYIPNFIETKSLDPNFTPGKYFIYIGRLSDEKGIATLILAFKKIIFKDKRLFVVGDGPIKSKLEGICKDNKNITFTGYLSGIGLKEITKNSLAVIVPSEWYENAPLSILEAFALGKPVIGAEIGGIPEMIDHGYDGLHFKTGDMNDLQEKLEMFLTFSKKRIKNMGKLARLKAEKNFSPELHYDKLMQVYSNVIDGI